MCAIVKRVEAVVQLISDTKMLHARDVSSDKAISTMLLHLPGVRLVYDSLHRLNVTCNSTASLVLATYVAWTVAWYILSFVLLLLVHTALFALITFYTFVGITLMFANTDIESNKGADGTYHPNAPSLKMKTPIVTIANPTLPLLSLVSPSMESKSIQADGAPNLIKKKCQTSTARRCVLTHLKRNRLLVNVVPGETRRRVDMNLSEATIRVGKAFVQTVPGTRKARDVYIVRVDCGGKSATEEKHMNPVVMWDVTATFAEFKQLERALKKELKAKNKSSGVKVPHLSSGVVLFVQPELTKDVLNARRVQLQTFIDSVRSDSVLSSLECLRKFCQAF